MIDDTAAFVDATTTLSSSASVTAGGLVFTDAEIAELEKLTHEGPARFSATSLKSAPAGQAEE